MQKVPSSKSLPSLQSSSSSSKQNDKRASLPVEIPPGETASASQLTKIKQDCVERFWRINQEGEEVSAWHVGNILAVSTMAEIEPYLVILDPRRSNREVVVALSAYEKHMQTRQGLKYALLSDRPLDLLNEAVEITASSVPVSTTRSTTSANIAKSGRMTRTGNTTRAGKAGGVMVAKPKLPPAKVSTPQSTSSSELMAYKTPSRGQPFATSPLWKTESSARKTPAFLPPSGGKAGNASSIIEQKSPFRTPAPRLSPVSASSLVASMESSPTLASRLNSRGRRKSARIAARIVEDVSSPRSSQSEAVPIIDVDSPERSSPPVSPDVSGRRRSPGSPRIEAAPARRSSGSSSSMDATKFASKETVVSAEEVHLLWHSPEGSPERSPVIVAALPPMSTRSKRRREAGQVTATGRGSALPTLSGQRIAVSPASRRRAKRTSVRIAAKRTSVRKTPPTSSCIESVSSERTSDSSNPSMSSVAEESTSSLVQLPTPPTTLDSLPLMSDEAISHEAVDEVVAGSIATTPTLPTTSSWTPSRSLESIPSSAAESYPLEGSIPGRGKISTPAAKRRQTTPTAKRRQTTGPMVQLSGLIWSSPTSSSLSPSPRT